MPSLSQRSDFTCTCLPARSYCRAGPLGAFDVLDLRAALSKRALNLCARISTQLCKTRESRSSAVATYGYLWKRWSSSKSLANPADMARNQYAVPESIFGLSLCDIFAFRRNHYAAYLLARHQRRAGPLGAVDVHVLRAALSK